ncbi:hypothetical protein OIU34_17225 [Pararhizobium sp. BT-229]|uniref:hypothetical protein n=1 Tax=Pararhizobium sp. BT-229 TaxID=2986923 RepID=UPI0021F7AFBD|nr:hypothetical protein [Pararhizobium sp. BT-229]MCV9963644.1 hypothetical protein [Pararhizobium sp. BT-229]
MLNRIVGVAVAIATFAAVGGAMAAEKCYKDVAVPSGLSCSDSSSKSADFTTGCKIVPAHTEKVETACEVGRWVNVAGTRVSSAGTVITHSQACAAHGLQPYNINGNICASGRRPARVGNGWETIIYRYGTGGDGHGYDGGDKVETRNQAARGPGNCSSCDSRPSTPARKGTLCYNNRMGEKNDEATDSLVAVYCR